MDKRQQKTRAAILDAFYKLICRKDLDQININDIINIANIGRSTFYLHFKTKEDLVKATYTSYFSDLLASLQSDDLYNTYYSIILFFAEKDSRALRIIASVNRDRFLDLFQRSLEEMFRSKDHAEFQFVKDGIPHQFLISHVTATIVNSIRWWLLTGRVETPENMARYFYSVIHPVLNS